MYSVLLVDDEPMVTDGMSRFFNWEELGFKVVSTATSVARALTFLESNDVDLVITDINMPVQNGIDLIRILKDEYPNIKTIILSGYSEFSYAQSAIRLGALDYLTKPINFHSLKSVLENAKDILDKLNSKDNISQLLKSTLLMNFINGYPYDKEKANTVVDSTKPIYLAKALVDSSQNIESFAERLMEEYKGVTILQAEENSVFMIFESVVDLDSLRLDLLRISRDFPGTIIGLSERGDDYSWIRDLALEAMKAMKYQYVTGLPGIMSYPQVKNQYIDIEKQHESLVKEMVEILCSNDKRDTIIEYYTTTLISLSSDLAFQKRFSTEALVEINLALRNYSSKESDDRGLLSTTLLAAANAQSKDELVVAVTKYLNFVKDTLDKRDGSILDGELSERVKAYINIHYREDLSLNTLAEFFM